MFITRNIFFVFLLYFIFLAFLERFGMQQVLHCQLIKYGVLLYIPKFWNNCNFYAFQQLSERATMLLICFRQLEGEYMNELLLKFCHAITVLFLMHPELLAFLYICECSFINLWTIPSFHPANCVQLLIYLLLTLLIWTFYFLFTDPVVSSSCWENFHFLQWRVGGAEALGMAYGLEY